MTLKLVFQIIWVLWAILISLAVAEAAAEAPLLKHNTTFSISFPLVDNFFEIKYSPDKPPFVKRINLEVLEISAGQKKFYAAKYCQTFIPAVLRLLVKMPKCYKYFFFIDEQRCNITVLKNFLEIQAQVEDFTDWKLYNFSYDLFADNAPFFTSKIFEPGKTGFLQDEESDHPDTTSDRFYKPWLVLVIVASLVGLFSLVWKRRWLCFRLREKLFKRQSGVSLLQQMINSYDGSVDKCKLFNSKELVKATNNFHANRTLGEGGQGTVYKGMLEDGRIIAVKKSKVVDEEKLEEFINELVVLSQINHRNVVKLLGCCLEAEVPLLVYEFISNGTLSQYIHNRNEEFPLTWQMRLRIATEVAGALSYLHSSAATPVYHRDIKSTNILLDEKYRAKVGDFGTSKCIAIDQTHVSTVVLGTLGYLDPEYYQSSQLTDKGDVYSFGVVLVELLTGEKPIFSAMQENINLANYFIHAVMENRLNDILDDQVKQIGKKEEIMAFANLAKRCLNMEGKERPTMKEVATELEGIRALKSKKGIVSKIMKYFGR